MEINKKNFNKKRVISTSINYGITIGKRIKLK